MLAEPITGLILAGGLGRRMGGCDKGMLPLCGRPLLAHVLERFAPQVANILVNTNAPAADYTRFGHPLVTDVIPGHAGPLAGLHAGLSVCTTPLLATVPCDAPQLPGDLVARLYAALTDGAARVAVAVAAGRRQPTFMLCRREVRNDLDAYLAGGGRIFGAWLADMGALEASFDDAAAFANINTPEELARQESAPHR